jgi:hypothetical protein
LFREARRKRSTTWRRTWRVIAVATLVAVLFMVVYGFVEWRHQFFVGVCVGCLATVLVGFSLFVFFNAEGSLVARFARLHEQSVCDLIFDAEGVFTVVPNIEFAGFDRFFGLGRCLTQPSPPLPPRLP